jgi:hypothetical protein
MKRNESDQHDSQRRKGHTLTAKLPVIKVEITTNRLLHNSDTAGQPFRHVTHLGTTDQSDFRGVVHSQNGRIRILNLQKNLWIFGIFSWISWIFLIFSWISWIFLIFCRIKSSKKNLWNFFILWGDFSDFYRFSGFFWILGIFRIFWDFFCGVRVF